ncbi:sulfotransferase family protein [Pelagibius marinus]|uniref:sulfotransferase family protein n=1 Tax=Pelagibius marinus TaxID=2762760 RepID=UPI001872EAC9|nr:sulfotransferase [Pelagibius marinus]
MAEEPLETRSSHMDRPILFVFGAARSGTTILNNLLYRHFSYGMGPEGTFVAQWARRLPAYGDLRDDANLERLARDVSQCRMLEIARHKYRRNPFDVTPELILSRMQERSYAGVVYSVFQCMAELQGCSRVGNKNPDYGRHFPLLHQLFPMQAKYLSIVRDGRDVALSIVKTRWGPSSCYAAAKAWMRALTDLGRMEEKLGPDRLHVLKYEDLLRQPWETLEGMRQFLRIPPAEAQVAAAAAEIADGKKSANFDKWRRQMSADDLRVFEGLAGDRLQRYGYELSGNGGSVRWRDYLRYESREYMRLAMVNARHSVSRLS